LLYLAKRGIDSPSGLAVLKPLETPSRNFSEKQ
jgi:hypothetical protein